MTVPVAGGIEHGGQVVAVMRDFPDAPRPFVDLSTGIGPVAYPFTMPDADAFHALPQADAERALVDAAVHAYGVSDSRCVVAGSGTQLLMGLIPWVLPAPHVTILSPTYGGHEQAWRLAGAPIARVRDVPALWSAPAGGTVVVCSPNNPDGRVVPVADLLSLAAHCARTGGRLVVDEAYADFASDSIAPHVARSGLVVLRSFGKSYGLAGMRLGFMLAEVAVAERVRAVMGAWPVGTVALAAGTQA
ncbi:aminotransferase class I/II-fold pyridoxal phosphate-dependent enzyme, partial [Ameyamaea chiangmaiensis]